ncbi:hypothetical protein [Chryseobacterium indologenes]|uniref:Uncharacterized protein n=1 Tax=Chryseobacterium indologenes TaxID=253 RepID=A0A0N0ZSM2_CHRID|nr:hypothetical protein [Chryseobacterium indologenes]KPE49416.1 hypothetical protein AOB46_19775 [Chryseobacterium indologenes]
MNKKIIILNVITILLVTAGYIFGIYCINYPMKFDILRMIKDSEIQYLPVIFAATALVTYLISSLDIKNLSFKNKFLRIFPVLNLPVLSFFMYMAITGFTENKRELIKRENYYIQKAGKDIKNDQVSREYGNGFFIPMYDQKTMSNIDSIRKKYGIMSKTSSCVFDDMDHKAREKYSELTESYLKKRNGKGWEERMNQEIEGLKKAKNSENK